ncbi:MAG: hypothetical protein M3680_32720, partial [Myxococcota bacterium]|nr:hypothetical protein [Myxococcota bacterium]
ATRRGAAGRAAAGVTVGDELDPGCGSARTAGGGDHRILTGSFLGVVSEVVRPRRPLVPTMAAGAIPDCRAPEPLGGLARPAQGSERTATVVAVGLGGPC